MAIRIPCGAKHRPVPEEPEGERIATAFGLAMTRKIEPGPMGDRKGRPYAQRCVAAQLSNGFSCSCLIHQILFLFFVQKSLRVMLYPKRLLCYNYLRGYVVF